MLGSASLVQFEEELNNDLEELQRLKIVGNNVTNGEGYPPSNLIAINHSKLNLRRFNKDLSLDL
ncbi:hypothetical protein GF357_02555 [Candidatus Dojkabacteria bacterium]|nr:hypothetical protein [Candidatus Dojkabacteria bacterium]